MTIYNPDKKTNAGGIAYGQAGVEHRTNSWAGQMSPFVHKPDDLVDWIEGNRGLENLQRPELRPFDLDQIGPNDPVPRRLYQIYLQDRCDQLVEKAKEVGVLGNFVAETGTVLAVHQDEESHQWQADYKTPYNFPGTNQHDKIVLAQGHIEGRKPGFLENLSPDCAALCEVDVWQGLDHVRAMMRDPAVKNLAVIGTGLTTYDMVVTAHEEGFFDRPDTKISLISRYGYRHQRDDDPDTKMPTIALEDLPPVPKTIEAIPGYIKGIYQHYMNQGYEAWTIERRMRPYVPLLIEESGIDPKALAGLLEKNNSLVTTSIVGVGQEIFQRVQEHIDSGQVEIVKAGVKSITRDTDRPDPGLIITATATESGDTLAIPVDRLLNATGFSHDYRDSKDTLTQQLAKDGLISTSPLTDMGISVDITQHPINRDGVPQNDLYLVGPITPGCAFMEGRVGAFAVNVLGLKGGITNIANDITGLIPQFVPSRFTEQTVLPSGPAGHEATRSIIPDSVLAETAKLFTNAKTHMTAVPDRARIVTEGLVEITNLKAQDFLKQAENHHDQGDIAAEKETLAIARHWFDQSRKAEKLVPPRQMAGNRR